MCVARHVHVRAPDHARRVTPACTQPRAVQHGTEHAALGFFSPTPPVSAFVVLSIPLHLLPCLHRAPPSMPPPLPPLPLLPSSSQRPPLSFSPRRRRLPFLLCSSSSPQPWHRLPLLPPPSSPLPFLCFRHRPSTIVTLFCCSSIFLLPFPSPTVPPSTSSLTVDLLRQHHPPPLRLSPSAVPAIHRRSPPPPPSSSPPCCRAPLPLPSLSLPSLRSLSTSPSTPVKPSPSSFIVTASSISSTASSLPVLIDLSVAALASPPRPPLSPPSSPNTATSRRYQRRRRRHFPLPAPR